MTAQLSRELLEKTIADWESVRDEIPFGLGEEGNNALAALKFALAGMDSEPVAVDEIAEQAGIDPAIADAYMQGYHDSEARKPAPVMPGELHPDTQKLVADFCAALAEKLYKAQLKYGYEADWKQDGWPSQCQAHFHQHIAKGDPRDVAAYCAFMWYHGWKTKPAPVAVPDRERVRGDHAKWSQETFGNVGPIGPLKHLSKEALEAAADPGDLSEWADMQFLLWDAQRRAGITDEQITAALEEKLKVNMARQWPEPKDGEPRLHIKAAPEQQNAQQNIPENILGGWIKCSERMPEEGGRYWCYVEEQNSLGKSHYQWNCSWNGDEWSDKALTGRVTHWMPLPAAPEQEV